MSVHDAAQEITLLKSHQHVSITGSISKPGHHSNIVLLWRSDTGYGVGKLASCQWHRLSLEPAGLVDVSALHCVKLLQLSAGIAALAICAIHRSFERNATDFRQ